MEAVRSEYRDHADQHQYADDITDHDEHIANPPPRADRPRIWFHCILPYASYLNGLAARALPLIISPDMPPVLRANH